MTMTDYDYDSDSDYDYDSTMTMNDDDNDSLLDCCTLLNQPIIISNIITVTYHITAYHCHQ